jgi:hypothetical protein
MRVSTIKEAKQRFRELHRYDEGFVGVGVSHRDGCDALRVYVVDSEAPLAQQLTIDGAFDGHPVEVIVSGEVNAYSQ